MVHEDIYNARPIQCANRIKSILGLNKTKLHGRKVVAKEIDKATGKRFLDDYHLMEACKADIFIGLINDEKIVAVGAFSKPLLMKWENPPYESGELVRFCTAFDTSIRGGLDKIIQHYIRNYSPDDIITYVDKEWSDGSSYERIGFRIIGTTPELSFELVDGRRIPMKDTQNENGKIVKSHGNYKLRLKI